ncbi:peptidylprolyl isomerase [Halosquirtibacter laminarini]|uniref:Peptidylprolyl isomerase n=1 Tax=Halosquirtibacter laminarini TaxID=3374600 RepID=A0AC61NEL7_9BACT|nr:peptidylprolyl isomerase [Prolixibacteraceae bacterium]
MNKYNLLICFILILWNHSLYGQDQKKHHVKISTSMGDIIVELYNDTPKHRDKFLKETKKSYYDESMFYRVINNFMIQAGAKGYQGASHSTRIGYGNPDFTVDDEIRKNHFAKKGALCAPRQPNSENPFKQSDISQFFIIQGRKYREGELDTLELARNIPIKKTIKKRYWNEKSKQEAKALKQGGKIKEYNALIRKIKEQINTEYKLDYRRLDFSDEQRKEYTTIGGYPPIDGEYTIFGEVIKGWSVIDRISRVKCDKFDRPWKDINLKLIVID